MAHLAFSRDPAQLSCAEFGVSVLTKARGRGYGARLFERAVMHARNEGVDMLFIHALSENTAMIKIARNAGATLDRAGSETDAYLRLPPATLDSRVSEMVEEQLALTDYRLKVAGQELLGLPGRRAGGPPGRARRAPQVRRLSKPAAGAGAAGSAGGGQFPLSYWSLHYRTSCTPRLCPTRTLRVLPSKRKTSALSCRRSPSSSIPDRTPRPN